MAIDQNGRPLYQAVRREPDGTWSAMVWWGLHPPTNVHRRYGYLTRAAARASDISESVEDTNLRVCGRTQ